MNSTFKKKKKKMLSIHQQLLVLSYKEILFFHIVDCFAVDFECHICEIESGLVKRFTVYSGSEIHI